MSDLVSMCRAWSHWCTFGRTAFRGPSLMSRKLCSLYKLHQQKMLLFHLSNQVRHQFCTSGLPRNRACCSCANWISSNRCSPSWRRRACQINCLLFRSLRKGLLSIWSLQVPLYLLSRSHHSLQAGVYWGFCYFSGDPLVPCIGPFLKLSRTQSQQIE